MVAVRVKIVFLRRPNRRDPREARDDPFWEFGSFGCTGCHRRNLLHVSHADELVGTRLAFVQGGPQGLKLVYLTPPIRVRRLPDRLEAVWGPAEMPLTYSSAPLVVDNAGHSSIPSLARMSQQARRRTPVSRFSSVFRSRGQDLPPDVGLQVLKIYDTWREKWGRVSATYTDAMPFPPPLVFDDRDERYRSRLPSGFAPPT